MQTRRHKGVCIWREELQTDARRHFASKLDIILEVPASFWGNKSSLAKLHLSLKYKVHLHGKCLYHFYVPALCHCSQHWC